jgi:hypothetical protein
MADNIEVSMHSKRTGNPNPNKGMIAALNAGSHFIAEIRRAAGPRTAAKALPALCAKLGIPIDLSVSDTLAQGEFDFRVESNQEL